MPQLVDLRKQKQLIGFLTCPHCGKGNSQRNIDGELRLTCSYCHKPMERLKQEQVWELRNRIRQEANQEQAEELSNDEVYGTPAAFFNNAQKFGLCSGAEWEMAYTYYKELWNYRGD